MTRIFWTDGSSANDIGGWAVVEEIPGSGKTSVRPIARLVASGAEQPTNNSRMEGVAIIAALELFDDAGGIIYTDSQYWVNVFKIWGPDWSRHHWQRANGGIKNVDLVSKAYNLYCKKPVEVKWVRAHRGNYFNELADRYSCLARKRLENQG